MISISRAMSGEGFTRTVQASGQGKGASTYQSTLALATAEARGPQPERGDLVTGLVRAAGGFEQEPCPLLGRVDEVLQQARRRDVLVVVANLVRLAHGL